MAPSAQNGFRRHLKPLAGCSGQGGAPMRCLRWPVPSSSAAKRRGARWTASGSMTGE